MMPKVKPTIELSEVLMSDERPSMPPVEMSINVPRSVMDARTELVDLRDQARRELEGVIVGYDEPLDLLLIAAVSGGHVLIEGPPGVAKTLMAGAVARLLGVSFKRVQFTPDTTPGEIIGMNVTRMGETTFQPGAAFTNVLLADEINRTPPRTQAALLEAMQDRNVTVGGRSHWLPSPFMVIATQNPFEQAGIFPLPESQLDRFLFKIDLDYTTAGYERAILRLPHRGLAPDVLGEIQPILDITRLQTAQGGARLESRARGCRRVHRRGRTADARGRGRHPRREPAGGRSPHQRRQGVRAHRESADRHA